MGGSWGSCGGGALLFALMLSFLAGDAVVEVLCDQRFTLAASWAALERRRLWWLEVVEAVEAVWGGSALAAAAMLEAAPARASGCSDRLLLRLTCELLREFVRDGRRSCVLLVGALMSGCCVSGQGVPVHAQHRASVQERAGDGDVVQACSGEILSHRSWSNCSLPSMSGGGEEHRVYVEASQAQSRDSAHGRSYPWQWLQFSNRAH